MNKDVIRERILSLDPTIFAVVIRERPKTIFNFFEGMTTIQKLVMRFFGIPETFVLEQKNVQVTVFILGSEFAKVANQLRDQEEFLKPTGLTFNFEIYQLDQDDFRTSKPFH